MTWQLDVKITKWLAPTVLKYCSIGSAASLHQRKHSCCRNRLLDRDVDALLSPIPGIARFLGKSATPLCPLIAFLGAQRSLYSCLAKSPARSHERGKRQGKFRQCGLLSYNNLRSVGRRLPRRHYACPGTSQGPCAWAYSGPFHLGNMKPGLKDALAT